MFRESFQSLEYFFPGFTSYLISVFSHPIILAMWSFIKSWWWVILPYICFKIFLILWKWWRTQESWLPKQEPVIIEVRIPAGNIKPIRAMENVMAELYQVNYRPPDLWEKWIVGQEQLSYSFDVVSLEGEIHFFIRFRKRPMKDAIEAIIYSQYPEAEIMEVDDYTKNVPSDIPNKEWDIWGSNYTLAKKAPYPIRTYDSFETEREPTEEKIIDPMSSLLESLSLLGKGEQYWLQILAKPVSKRDFPKMSYWSEINEVIEELSRRKKPAKKSIFGSIFFFFLTGKMGEDKKEEKEIIPPEMKLTPGERETLAAVERKTGKLSFDCVIRFVYLGKGKAFFKPHGRLLFGYFSSFATTDHNALVIKGQPIITKIKSNWFLPINLLKKRRLYIRKRRLFRLYRMREDPFFPKPVNVCNIILSTEELATIYHFPAKGTTLAPSVPRTETRKGEAPAGLPIE